jgi:hypothetical protein
MGKVGVIKGRDIAGALCFVAAWNKITSVHGWNCTPVYYVTGRTLFCASLKANM